MGRVGQVANFPFPFVSRLHCTAVQGDTHNTIVLVDQNSSNGTFVNGVRVAGACNVVLFAGDTVVLGANGEGGAKIPVGGKLATSAPPAATLVATEAQTTKKKKEKKAEEGGGAAVGSSSSSSSSSSSASFSDRLTVRSWKTGGTIAPLVAGAPSTVIIGRSEDRANHVIRDPRAFMLVSRAHCALLLGDAAAPGGGGRAGLLLKDLGKTRARMSGRVIRGSFHTPSECLCARPPAPRHRCWPSSLLQCLVPHAY
jgi:pSer/pThr/pTyr-binding forkhead associated (FHA) protein